MTSLNDGGLSPARPAADEGATSYSYPDWEWRNGVVAFVDGRPDPVRRVLTFTSAPLDADIEVTGPIVLKLLRSSAIRSTRSSSSSSPTSIRRMTPRARRASSRHRHQCVEGLAEGLAPREGRGALDRACGRSTPTPIRSRSTPDEIYEFDIEVLPVSYVFKKGHRIRLEIVNGDSPLTDAVFSHPYHPTQIGTDTIYHDAAHASCLMLPVVG